MWVNAMSVESERNKAIMAGFWRDAFPHIRHLPMELIADGDKVVAPWTIEGTHTRPFAGIEPTGRRVRVSGIQIDRLRGGKVVESWNHSSDTGIVAQLKTEA